MIDPANATRHRHRHARRRRPNWKSPRATISADRALAARVGTAVPGQGITYTIVVSNAGPSDVTGAAVDDTLPSTLSGATFTAMATGGASGFTASGSGSIADSDVDLPAGSTVTYTVQATIASSASGTLSNTATVTRAGGRDRDQSDKRHRHRHRYAHAAGRSGNHQDRQSGRIEPYTDDRHSSSRRGDHVYDRGQQRRAQRRDRGRG